MMNWMTIGNIDRCWDVVQKVWRRRDNAAVERRPQLCGLVALSSVALAARTPVESDDEDLTLQNAYLANDRFHGIVESHPQQTGPGVPYQARKLSLPALQIRIDPDMTVRGKLHWVAVMKEWNWESKSRSHADSYSHYKSSWRSSTSWMTAKMTACVTTYDP